MQRRIGNRRLSRVALEARALGRAFPASLHDVSLTGCRFDCSGRDLGRGDRIVFTFAEGIKIPGRIAWRRWGVAGVRFARPLPREIAAHLDFTPRDGPGA